tara:strand:+ start:1395 stop:2219 length:825 start_codon:yes stop_codon:yes gene_type:complete
MSKPLPVDFHVHLDLYPDMERAYAYCADREAITLAVTTTPKAYERNLELADRHPNIHVALGLHPQLIAQRSSEVQLFELLVGEAQFIGEVGLDASRKHYPSFFEQERVFERLMHICHERRDKVLTVHSVRSAAKVLATLERSRVYETCKVVLHWFSASNSEIQRAISMGCMFSVNESHLASDAGKRLVSSVPASSLLTETDGPFIERDGTVVKPSDVGPAIRMLGLLKKVSASRMAATVERNARTLFPLTLPNAVSNGRCLTATRSIRSREPSL